jgi:hypothetical protein
MNQEVAKVAKVAKKYTCEYCDYISCKESNYIKHLGTAKHKKKSSLNNFEQFEQKKSKECLFVCKKCDKSYKGRNGLWYHEQKCGLVNNTIVSAKQEIDSSSNEFKAMTGLMIELVKSNSDLQKQVLEICKNSNSHNTNNSHNNTNTNSHNKTFNLQFFLNEECKDAMNLSEFVDSIQLKLSDLENIGKLGYVEGISNIIIKELNDTQLNKRPVHCSDVKRETLYVKDENKWEKDTDDTKKMVRAVHDVDKKASKLLMTDWKDANPNCTDNKTRENKQFITIAGEVNDGDGKNVKSVIKKVAKQVVLDK